MIYLSYLVYLAYLVLGLVIFLGAHSVRMVADGWRTRTRARVARARTKAFIRWCRCWALL